MVGGDSLVGCAVADYLGTMGYSVFVTSRRTDRIAANRITLDLANCSAFRFQPSTVLMCASITNIAFVENAQSDSCKINVEAVIELARNLHSNGSHIIYISSVGVFGNSSALISTATHPFPANVYGRQKVDVERELLSLGVRIAVVRPTKVVSCVTPIFLEWIQRLRMGIEIKPFSDFCFCPVSLRFLAYSLGELALLRPTGIFHLSGGAQVSYAEFAIALARSMGAARSLVVPVHSAELSVPAFYPQRQPCLEMLSTTSLLGVKAQSLQSVIDDLLVEFTERYSQLQN